MKETEKQKELFILEGKEHDLVDRLRDLEYQHRAIIEELVEVQGRIQVLDDEILEEAIERGEEEDLPRNAWMDH